MFDQAERQIPFWESAGEEPKWELPGSGNTDPCLEIHVRADARNQYWTTVPVVAWIVDVGHLECSIEPSVHVCVIVTFADHLPAIVQTAIAENKAESTQSEVFAMVLADAIGCKRSANFVEGAVPGFSGEVCADGEGAIDLGVGERLFMAFIPADAREGAGSFSVTPVPRSCQSPASLIPDDGAG